MVTFESIEPLVTAVISMFTVAMIIYSIRAFTAKNLGDVTLAVDALTSTLVVILILIALYYRSSMLLIGAIPLASWIFLTDLVVSRYLEKRGGRR